jgi:hypothetical protein
MTSLINQLSNDPDDPRLNTAEYEFLFKFYKGVWRRHVDFEDPMFSDIWDYINRHHNTKAKYNKKSKVLTQSFELGDTIYEAVWTDCSSLKKIEGPPDYISWQNPMLPPCNIQKSLF